MRVSVYPDYLYIETETEFEVENVLSMTLNAFFDSTQQSTHAVELYTQTQHNSAPPALLPSNQPQAFARSQTAEDASSSAHEVHMSNIIRALSALGRPATATDIYTKMMEHGTWTLSKYDPNASVRQIMRREMKRPNSRIDKVGGLWTIKGEFPQSPTPEHQERTLFDETMPEQSESDDQKETREHTTSPALDSVVG